jgi:hypothetical protein
MFTCSKTAFRGRLLQATTLRTDTWRVLGALIVLLSMAGAPVLAQEAGEPDRWNELWLDFGVKGKLAKDLKGYGEVGYRTGDELGRGKQIYLNGELRYKLHKYIDAGLEQRAAFRFNDEDRFRTGLMLMTGERFGRTTLGYRLNYQHVWREPGTVRDVLRNRFEVGYDIKGFQFDPDASVEFFTALGPDGSEYDAVRYKLGTSWTPKKGHQISFALVHDREQNRKTPDYRWVFAFSYGIDLGKV